MFDCDSPFIRGNPAVQERLTELRNQILADIREPANPGVNKGRLAASILLFILTGIAVSNKKEAYWGVDNYYSEKAHYDSIMRNPESYKREMLESKISRL